MIRLLAFSVLLLTFAAPASAKVASGSYEGKVAAGYGAPQFQLTVAKRKAALVARMFQSCNHGPLTQTVIAPDQKVRISASGSFNQKIVETIPDVGTSTVWISGRFSGSRVSGKIREQWAGSGQVCDTQQRRFSAKRR